MLLLCLSLFLSQVTLDGLGILGATGTLGALSTASAPSAPPRPRRPLDGLGILGFYLWRYCNFDRFGWTGCNLPGVSLEIATGGSLQRAPPRLEPLRSSLRRACDMAVAALVPKGAGAPTKPRRGSV